MAAVAAAAVAQRGTTRAAPRPCRQLASMDVANATRPALSEFARRVEAHNAAVIAALPTDAAAALSLICRPQHWQDVGVAVLGFVGVLALGCGFFELINTKRCEARAEAKTAKAALWLERRANQMIAEVAESIVPVCCSTAFTLWWFHAAYTLRWGVGPPMTPLSLTDGVVDVLSWLLNFEIFGYWTHRLLHVERSRGCG